MKAQAIIFTLLAAGGLVGRIRADLCGQGANEIEGNWFCQAVSNFYLSPATLSLVKAQGCSCDRAIQLASASEIANAQWQVDAIRYSNVGTPGTYQQVTEISTDGTCTSSPKQFAGPIAPLDEEVRNTLKLITSQRIIQ